MARVPRPEVPGMSKKSDRRKPYDYLRGSIKPGGKYTAWNTYGQGKPDFGYGKGPGEPYHEVQKRVTAGGPQMPPRGRPGSPTKPIVGAGDASTLPWGKGRDPRIEAIRRRLRGL